MAAGYDGANARAEWLLAQVEPGGELNGLDFVVSGGDLIHGENLPSIGVEMAALRERLRRLPVPFFPCCGNHEVKQAEGDPAFEEPYRRTFGEDRFDYAIPAGPAEIIVLNNAGTFHVVAARREARFEAFKRLLANRPGVPKILVCHVPLLPVRDNDTLRESFGFLSYKTLEVELVDALEVHGRDVRLVISGHLHLTGMVEHRGVRHLVTSGTASFPHHYPVITVTGEGIDVEVRSLPESLHEPATNLHGRPRYAHDYTDSAHPDGDSYVRGNPGERRFFVSFGSG
jgi:DNA repair exonuclease SbcCD nuclease subunit